MYNQKLIVAFEKIVADYKKQYGDNSAEPSLIAFSAAASVGASVAQRSQPETRTAERYVINCPTD